MDRRRPLQTLNGRLPLKLGSDRPQTLPKRVSDDPRHFIVRRKQTNHPIENQNIGSAECTVVECNIGM